MLFTPAYIFSILLGIWVLSLVGCIVLGIFCYRLIVDRGRLLLRVEDLIAQRPGTHPGGLKQGSYLSDVALPVLATSAGRETGAEVAVAQLITADDRPHILMFLDTACLYSRALARELQDRVPRPQDPGMIAIISGAAPAAPAFPAFPGVRLHDLHRQAAQLYGVSATPAGYLVTPTRHTSSPILLGPAALLQAAQGEMPQGNLVPQPVTPLPRDAPDWLEPLSAGDTLPQFHPGPGTEAPWADFVLRGAPFGLLFIEPGYPPCEAALSLLARCGDPLVLIVSQGEVDDPANVQAASLPGASCFLQTERDVSRAFGLIETPAFYEIEGNGVIRAGPIIGLQEIRKNWARGICRNVAPEDPAD